MSKHYQKNKTDADAINAILEFFGGISGLANNLKCTRQAIYQWLRIPPARAYQIQVLSKGKFIADDIKHLSFRFVERIKTQKSQRRIVK